MSEMWEQTKTLTGRLALWPQAMDKQEMRGLPVRLISDLSEARAELERLYQVEAQFAVALEAIKEAASRANNRLAAIAEMQPPYQHSST